MNSNKMSSTITTAAASNSTTTTLDSSSFNSSSMFSLSSNGNLKLNSTLNNNKCDGNDAINLSKSFLNTLEKFKENLKNDLKIKKKKVNDLESNVSSYPCCSIKLLYDDVKNSIHKTHTQMNLFLNLINELKSLEERYAAVINDFKQNNCVSIANSKNNGISNNNCDSNNFNNTIQNEKINNEIDKARKNDFDEIYNLIMNELKLKEIQLKKVEININKFPSFSTRLLYTEVKNLLCKLLDDVSMLKQLRNEMNLLEQRYEAVVADISNKERSNNNNNDDDVSNNDNINISNNSINANTSESSSSSAEIKLISAPSAKNSAYKIPYIYRIKNRNINNTNNNSPILKLNAITTSTDIVAAAPASTTTTPIIARSLTLSNSTPKPINEISHSTQEKGTNFFQIFSAIQKHNMEKTANSTAAKMAAIAVTTTTNAKSSTLSNSTTKPINVISHSQVPLNTYSRVISQSNSPSSINSTTNSIAMAATSSTSPTNSPNKITAPIYSVPSTVRCTDKPQILSLAVVSSQSPFANTVKNPVLPASPLKANLLQQHLRSSPPKTVNTTAVSTSPAQSPSSSSLSSSTTRKREIALNRTTKDVDKNVDQNLSNERKRKFNEILMTTATNIRNSLLNINFENQIQQKETNRNETENKNKTINENGKTSNDEKRIKLDNGKETIAINNNNNSIGNRNIINNSNFNKINVNNNNNNESKKMETDSKIITEDKQKDIFCCSYCQLEFTDNETYLTHVDSHVKATEKMKNSNLKIKINSKCEKEAPIEKRSSTSSNSEKDITKSSPEISREKSNLKAIYDEQTNMQSDDANKSTKEERRVSARSYATLGTGKPGYITCQICNSKRYYSRVCRRFGIFACESCYRQFNKFQHNPIQYYCYKDGNCVVDPKLCKSCWLKKCLELFTIDESMKLNIKKNFPPKIMKKTQLQQQQHKDQNENKNNTEINTGNNNHHNENKNEKINCVVCKTLFQYKSSNEQNYLSKLFTIKCCDHCDEFLTNFIALKTSYKCDKNGKCSLNQTDRCKACWLQKGLKIFQITPTEAGIANVNETSKSNAVSTTTTSSSSSNLTLSSSSSSSSSSSHGSRKSNLESNTTKIDTSLSTTNKTREKAVKKLKEKVHCVYCNQQFSSSNNLQHHMAMVHPSLIQNKDLPTKLRKLHRKSLGKFLKDLYPNK